MQKWHVDNLLKSYDFRPRLFDVLSLRADPYWVTQKEEKLV
jgi:hypothetical protein